jgi:hypothetical protein
MFYRRCLIEDGDEDDDDETFSFRIKMMICRPVGKDERLDSRDFFNKNESSKKQKVISKAKMCWQK